jgi:DNA-directed RNA polymerase sigma subunit (sigma70/sigma32)
VLVGLSERRVLVRWVVRDVEHDGLPERGGLVDDRDGAELIAERKDLLRVLWELGKCLQIRPWRVLCLRYGLLGGPPLTLEETAKECCVTRERVRQIEMRAVERLRKECEKRGLRFEDLVIE